jgi:hypothetical protein
MLRQHQTAWPGSARVTPELTRYISLDCRAAVRETGGSIAGYAFIIGDQRRHPSVPVLNRKLPVYQRPKGNGNRGGGRRQTVIGRLPQR